MIDVLDDLGSATPFEAARLARELEVAATSLKQADFQPAARSGAAAAEQTFSQLTGLLARQAELFDLRPLRELADAVRQQAAQFEEAQRRTQASSEQVFRQIAEASQWVADVVSHQEQQLQQSSVGELLRSFREQNEKLSEMVKALQSEQAELRRQLEGK